jgi:hypothetical protein
MIGIGEEDLNTQLFELALRHSLHRAGGPDRHEDRSLDGAVGRVKQAGTGAGGFILSQKLEGHGKALYRKRAHASAGAPPTICDW